MRRGHTWLRILQKIQAAAKATTGNFLLANSNCSIERRHGTLILRSLDHESLIAALRARARVDSLEALQLEKLFRLLKRDLLLDGGVGVDLRIRLSDHSRATRRHTI